MMKIIYNLLLIVGSTTLGFAQEISAIQTLPKSITNDTSFEISISVIKSATKGFLKYSQDLPKDFSATEIESKSGSFKANDTSVRIIWITPPIENEFIIRYKLAIAKNITGTFSIGGKFYFVVDSIRKMVEVPKSTLQVTSKHKMETTQKNNSSENTITQTKVQKRENTNSLNPETENLIFKIQIGVFSTEKKFTDVPEISVIKTDAGLFKYFSGNFFSSEEAQQRKLKLVEKGYKSAFVVKFINGKISK